MFRFPPSEVVRFFRHYHGPTNRAFASRNRARRTSLQTEMEELWSTYNLAKGGFTKVDAEWLEVIAVVHNREGLTPRNEPESTNVKEDYENVLYE